MQIFRGVLELLDYVFFATVERGKVYETGPFIHNYALAYALRLARSPYSCLEQRPDYHGELSELNARGLYLTPAHPIRTSYRLSQWNTIREAYGFGKKPQSIGYPDWGFARVLGPGSSFEFYLLVARPEAWAELPSLRALGGTRVAYLRLGKFLGKARVRFSRAEAVVQRRGPYTATVVRERDAGGEAATSLLLNWRDLPAEPVACTIYPATLPTRLVADAQFLDGDHYVAQFGQGLQVVLPAGMRFLARAEA